MLGWQCHLRREYPCNDSLQHSDEDGCTLDLCSKFEINLGLFAIWLAACEFVMAIKTWYYVWAAVPSIPSN